MPDTTLALADFIENLRGELQDAMSRGDGQALRFQAETVDLELKVAAERAVDGSGKISFKIFGAGASAGGGASASDTLTQTVKLSLKLVDAEGETPLISGRAQGRSF